MLTGLHETTTHSWTPSVSCRLAKDKRSLYFFNLKALFILLILQVAPTRINWVIKINLPRLYPNVLLLQTLARSVFSHCNFQLIQAQPGAVMIHTLSFSTTWKNFLRKPALQYHTILLCTTSFQLPNLSRIHYQSNLTKLKGKKQTTQHPNNIAQILPAASLNFTCSVGSGQAKHTHPPGPFLPGVLPFPST